MQERISTVKSSKKLVQLNFFKSKMTTTVSAKIAGKQKNSLEELKI